MSVTAGAALPPRKGKLARLTGALLRENSLRGGGNAHEGGLSSAVGPQQGGDLVLVEAERQVPNGRPVGRVLLGHRHQGDSFPMPLPVGWGRPWRRRQMRPERRQPPQCDGPAAAWDQNSGSET